MTASIDMALAVARVSLRLGKVERATRHEDGSRETDTTHTVMLALLAMEIAPALGMSAGRAAQFAIVHDLHEAYAGDVDTMCGLSPEEASAKAEREKAAIMQLTADLGPGARVPGLLRWYEMQVEPEARLVRLLDKVLPKLTHFLSRGVALAEKGLTLEDVQRSHTLQARALIDQYPEMGEVHHLFADACKLAEGVSEETTSEYLEREGCDFRPTQPGHFIHDEGGDDPGDAKETA